MELIIKLFHLSSSSGVPHDAIHSLRNGLEPRSHRRASKKAHHRFPVIGHSISKPTSLRWSFIIEFETFMLEEGTFKKCLKDALDVLCHERK